MSLKNKIISALFLLIAIFATYMAITPTAAESSLIEKAHLISTNSKTYEKQQAIIDQANKILAEATQKRDQAEADNVKLREELQATAKAIDTDPKATGAGTDNNPRGKQ